MVNGMRNVSVRYTFESWNLFGEPTGNGFGFRLARIDEMYAETVEDAMHRVAIITRRLYKARERMEITCTAEGQTRVFKFNV